MTEAGGVTAGMLLRAARERQGTHIAVLAAAIKVSPRKLDALERDRYEELTDATFVRALALTVCRALKIDAAPVLALLPQQNPAPLQQVGGGLNAPFRERPGRNDPTPSLPQRPLVWAGLLLLVAAALIAFAPPSVWQWLTGDGDSAASAPASAAPVDGAAPPASAANLSAPAAAGLAGATPSAGFAVSAASAALPTVETVHVAPAEARIAGAGPNTATISTNDVSWVEVFDGAGRTLLSRSVPPGEVVRLEGTLPLRLKIGNARATQLVFRGQPVDLAPSTRDNVARLELK